MRSWFAALPCFVLIVLPAMAEQMQGGPITLEQLDANHEQIDAAHRTSVSRARAMGLETAASAAAERARRPNLDFPVRLAPHAKSFRGYGNANYVDHAGAGTRRDFACMQRTYDGHTGTDFVAFPFWWRMMDGEELEVVAAAPGVIVNKQDGKNDRQCTIDFGTPANFVVIRQDDGYYAYYWHLKKGSVTRRGTGSRVERGEQIGLVGSSGASLNPHLHFELRTANSFGGSEVDPFEGRCGANTSLWKHQAEVFDADLLRLATHNRQPPAFYDNFCTNPDPGYSDIFAPGDLVWPAVYLREVQPTSTLTLSVIGPDGEVQAKWLSPPIPRSQNLTVWYVAHRVRTPGQWKLRAVLDGKPWEHAFTVGAGTDQARVQAGVQPQARSVRTQTDAKFEVTVRNVSSARARGCALAPDAPLAAVWNYRLLDRGASRGPLSPVFDVAPGAKETFEFTIRPKPDFVARGMHVPLRIFCNNANAPDPSPRFNLLTLSFQDTATLDIVPVPNDDVLRINGPSGRASVRVTATNKGAADAATVRVSTSHDLPLTVQLCQVNASNACMAPPARSVHRNFPADGTTRWRIFAKAKGGIPLDLLGNRVLLEFVDGGGIVRGATSVAVTTGSRASDMAATE